MIDAAFVAFFQVVPYELFQGIIATVIIVEFFYTIVVEQVDML